MPDLSFQIESATAAANSATPAILFRVRITDAEKMPIQSAALRVQVQIEPARRRYTAEEQEALHELFGAPEMWSRSVRPLLWADLSLNVPAFDGSTVIDLLVPCTFDFNIAVTKYIHGLDAGEIPVTLLFSGTLFHAGRMGLQIAKVPWDRDASFRLPVQTWKEMMDRYYPRTAWLCLPREVMEKLRHFQTRQGIANLEQAMERLLEQTEEVRR